VLKVVFWALLFLNGMLFAYGQGYLGKFQSEEREPARMKRQLSTERLTLVAPGQLPLAATSVTPADPAGPATPALVACTAVGNLNAAEARRFEARLARLDLGERQSRESVQVQDITSHLVYLPPQGGKEGADRRAAELRNRGVSNFFIMSGDSPLKWSISLGVFKTEAAARTQLAALGRQGVQGARLLGRGPQVARFAWQFRDIDADTHASIASIAASFPGVQVESCGDIAPPTHTLDRARQQ
jgi:hypothetical protein